VADVLGVLEFRSSLPSILRRLRESGEVVLVGAYRRPQAALVPIERVEEVGPGREHSPNLPAIRELLRMSPQERLEGLVNAAGFFAAASRA